MNDKITCLDKIKSFFSKDKRAFWLKHFSDYEKELSRMDTEQLATELERTKIRGETTNTTIVEHIIATRLVKIQTRTSWRIAVIGFIISIIIAIVSFYFGKSTCAGNDSQVISKIPNGHACPYKSKEQPCFTLPVGVSKPVVIIYKKFITNV